MSAGQPIPESIGQFSVYYFWNGSTTESRIFTNDWQRILREFERLAGDSRATNIRLMEGRVIATANTVVTNA
jgi:hypothetical protein